MIIHNFFYNLWLFREIRWSIYIEFGIQFQLQVGKNSVVVGFSFHHVEGNNNNILMFFLSMDELFRCVVSHSGSKRLKLVKNKFAQNDFTYFSLQVSVNSHNFHFRRLHLLQIQNLSNRCRHKYDQWISRIFSITFLAGLWRLVQLCASEQD